MIISVWINYVLPISNTILDKNNLIFPPRTLNIVTSRVTTLIKIKKDSLIKLGTNHHSLEIINNKLVNISFAAKIAENKLTKKMIKLIKEDVINVIRYTKIWHRINQNY